MYCAHCGSQLPTGADFCTQCGRPVAAPRTPRLEDDAAMRMLMPVGRTGLSIAAGYAGLAALLILPAPVALVLGIAAVRELKRDSEKRGMGRAVFGLVLGGLGTLLLVLMLILILFEG